ncbi:hypothetical protein LGM75_23015 [Burkholderia multivorans]|uniref:hypothetical protein n=1 Tax=Burkholderia multivorans TaxID=87883 RepID=UPI001C24578C|nr:hypothetical protein [Burkholderia multivorans]MBU9468149.1 hypothetical protein [Burkholderia multivorans]MCA8129226.1 hypothetical protein [Burkholderia multivorans]HEJ2441812.1 hypothetical protein [Burkholderia multivorans]
MVEFLEQQCAAHRNLETATFDAVRALEDALGSAVERRMFRAAIGLPEFATTETGRKHYSLLRTYSSWREPIDARVAPRFITHAGSIMQALKHRGGMKAIRGEAPEPTEFAYEDDEEDYAQVVQAGFSPDEGRRDHAHDLAALRRLAESQAKAKGLTDPRHIEGFVRSLLRATSAEVADEGRRRRAFETDYDPLPVSDF